MTTTLIILSAILLLGILIALEKKLKDNTNYKLFKLTILLPLHTVTIYRFSEEALHAAIADSVVYPGWSLKYWQGRFLQKVMYKRLEKIMNR